MTIPRIGEPARSFRLPSAQGSDIGLDDFQGRRAVVLWFTKGMACVFCRQQMSQLARVYPQIKERAGEVLEVTNSTPARAGFYARQFKLPFPYLCDPDHRVHRQWGLGVREHGIGYYVGGYIKGAMAPKPPNDIGYFFPPIDETRNLVADDDMGFFIVDKRGTVRYSLARPYGESLGDRPLPSNEEVLLELGKCQTAAA
jgi:peroxiredoxin